MAGKSKGLVDPERAREVLDFVFLLFLLHKTVLEINSVCNIHITLLQKISVHYGIIQASELGQVCVAHP